MELRFYVTDDLRLKPEQQTERSFLCLERAIECYQSLPPSVVKTLGISTHSNLRHMELVCCIPLFPTDIAGENIFLSGSVLLPEWQADRRFMDTAKELVSRLKIRFCLDGKQIIPAPVAETLPDSLADKCLWREQIDDPRSAIHELYVAGVGWVSPEALDRSFSFAYRDHHYPLVLKYRADGLDEQGNFSYLELTPWEFKQLDHRTQMRVDQNSSRRK